MYNPLPIPDKPPPALRPHLPLRSQRDIQAHGKLNFHLYLALKRALYKPSAFFKGLLLPLCESDCTIRQAHIIASVLSKVSVPMLHSAVCRAELVCQRAFLIDPADHQMCARFA